MDPSNQIYQYTISNHSFYIKNYKTLICDDYQLKKCPFDSKSCFYSHSKKPGRRINRKSHNNSDNNFGIFYSSEICPQLLTEKSCNKENSCEFAHTKQEIRYHPHKFKTRFCSHPIVPATGFCSKYGVHCHYAHGANDIRLSIDQPFIQNQQIKQHNQQIKQLI